MPDPNTYALKMMKLQALVWIHRVECLAMESRNTIRTTMGQSLAYGEDAFMEVADNLRGVVREMEALEAQIEEDADGQE